VILKFAAPVNIIEAGTLEHNAASERLADAVVKPLQLRLRERIRRAARMHSGGKAAFIAVNIANPGDEALVEQQRLQAPSPTLEEPLEDGKGEVILQRFSPHLAGSERFEILDYYRSPADYLVGRVLPVDDEDADPLLFLDQTNPLSLSFKTYLELRMRLNDEDIEDFDYQLPNDPAILSYQIATMLDVSLAEKQNLLELRGLKDRLNQEKLVLKREIGHLRQMLSTQRKPRVEHLPWGGEVHLN